MAKLKQMIESEDPMLIAQSLELVAAFRDIRNPAMRQAVTDLARALRTTETKAARRGDSGEAGSRRLP